MHDVHGRPLAVGDTVLIPAVITEISSSSDDFCNVSVETLFGRRPDDQKERVSAINTGVLVRANDALDFLNGYDEDDEDESGDESANEAGDTA